MAGIYNASAKASTQTRGKINNAGIPDINSLIQAGINPRTGLPIKLDNSGDGGFRNNNRKLLRIMDEQAAINSIKWYNLPNGLSGRLIERILYYKGQGMFFYIDTMDQFFFLPYALDGTIDVYGRFVSVTPLPFNGTANDGKEDEPWITGLTRKVKYDIELNALTYEEVVNSCVLLHDYSPQISQTNISRQVLNDPLLSLEADMLPFARTALLNSTGVMAMRVNSQDEQSNVKAASQSVTKAALEGDKYIAVVGNIDFQELTGGSVANAEQFLMTMQSIDNYRLSLHGLDSGGIFQKQQHMLQDEFKLNQGKSSMVMQDRLANRQDFCDVVNSIFGLDIWCDVSETALGMDTDGDFEAYDNEPDTVSYVSSESVMDDEGAAI